MLFPYMIIFLNQYDFEAKRFKFGKPDDLARYVFIYSKTLGIAFHDIHPTKKHRQTKY